MASHSHDGTFNFDFDFAMPQQSFDGMKASGQGNTAGYFDEGIDTTDSSGSLFGQQSFEPMMDPSMITGFGMEQPLVSCAAQGASKTGNTGRCLCDIACQGSFGGAIPKTPPPHISRFRRILHPDLLRCAGQGADITTDLG
jgi:hypothetical protein